MIKAPTNKPLVSIVVITYNSSNFVLETLESCKAQTYDNIQLIISDDASTDDTMKICQEWIEINKDRFNGFEILKSNVNAGVSANLNRGVYASKGEWFKLCAGDDLLLPNCVTDNVNYILKNQDKDISIISSIRLKFRDSLEGHRHVEYPGPPSVFFHPDISVEDQFELAVRNISPPINTFFIKKEVFEKVGGCDESIPLYEDGPLLFKLLNDKNKVYGINAETVMYRIHDESLFRIGKKINIYDKWTLDNYYKGIIKYHFTKFSLIEKVIFLYKLNLAKITYGTFLNRKNFINRLVNKIVVFPADFLYKINRRILKVKYIRKYGS